MKVPRPACTEYYSMFENIFVKGTPFLGFDVLVNRWKLYKTGGHSLLKKIRNVFSGRSQKAKPLVALAGKKRGGCHHYFGYLSSLAKKAPIPEECLTCQKMLDCRYPWS